MSPCSPSDNNIDVSGTPGNPIPGLGIPFSPIQLPYPDIDLPTGLVEDLVELMGRLGALFPSSLFKANLDSKMKNVMDFIANILSQISPFLSFYNFIMAALKLFVCIIEVLCALPDPIAVALKLRKLFAECLPPFIALFPWLALLAMIISLLLLILALIEYIINTIIAIIESIIKNLEVLALGLSLQDADATLAAINKIASLLCIIQNILAVLVAIAAIMAIIEALAKLAGFAVCDDNDEEGCCNESLCPPFIKNNASGITVTTGTLVYNKEIQTDVSTVFSSLGIPGIENILSVPALRKERWQIYDDAGTHTYPIKSIITPIDGKEFWPGTTEFISTTPLRDAPYTVDMTITLDPDDGYGSRVFQIKDCIVVRRPYIGLYDYAGVLQSTPISGTLNIEGGLVYEEDGTTAYLINGTQATLNTFIHSDSALVATSPLPNDTVTHSNVEFTWKPNGGALASHELITVGCMPEVNVEKAIQNSIIIAEGILPVSEKLALVPPGKKLPSLSFLPNITGAQQCVTDALTTFRKSITAENAATFQAAVQTCLTDLQDQTLFAYCGAIVAAVSQFKSEATLDTDIQFTTRPIKTSVVLKDAAGTIISNNIPESCASDLAEKLTAEVTVGEISDFEYDGSQFFTAEITSKDAGTGTLTVLFNNKVFSTITVAVGDTPTSITETETIYTFIDGTTESPVRRDAGDVAGQG